jgi:ABC-type transport system substrate-binding protein
MWRIGWINAYAEGDAFAQLLYGRNIGQTNYARFDLPAYDELYRRSRTLPDGAERNALYRKMSELVAAYAPWALHVYTVENTLVQPRVTGYRKHAYWSHPCDVSGSGPDDHLAASRAVSMSIYAHGFSQYACFL